MCVCVCVWPFYSKLVGIKSDANLFQSWVSPHYNHIAITLQSSDQIGVPILSGLMFVLVFSQRHTGILTTVQQKAAVYIYAWMSFNGDDIVQYTLILFMPPCGVTCAMHFKAHLNDQTHAVSFVLHQPRVQPSRSGSPWSSFGCCCTCFLWAAHHVYAMFPYYS